MLVQIQEQVSQEKAQPVSDRKSLAAAADKKGSKADAKAPAKPADKKQAAAAGKAAIKAEPKEPAGKKQAGSKGAAGSAAVKREKKVFEMPGQTRDAPSEVGGSSRHLLPAGVNPPHSAAVHVD